MSATPVRPQVSAEHAITVVKRLSPTELRKFKRQFTQWQKQDQQQMDEEAVLLACIEENSSLPADKQKRYERLRQKCERKTLTERELAEYRSLLQQLEARNVKRVEALSALAQRRGTTLRGIMADLGLQSAADAD
jgi:hypothetical protein